jgi:putative transposase
MGCMPMPHTYSSLSVHAVFATSGRRKLITLERRYRLHAYIGGILRNLKAAPIAIGGVEDHAHVLFDLPLTTTVADVIRVVKTNSSTWMKASFGAHFAWQRGYAAFSVSPRRREAVVRYIQEQEAHHRTKPFDDEYRELLELHGSTFDARFLWT